MKYIYLTSEDLRSLLIGRRVVKRDKYFSVCVVLKKERV